MSEVEFRPGGEQDAKYLLDMFDGAVAWMNARGNTQQWGTEPWSAVPKRVERVRGMAAGGNLVLAEIGGEPAGAIILDPGPPEHVPTVDEPEIYLGLLITARGFTGRQVGAELIRYALGEAAQRGIDLVRVDCYAGGDGSLVRYYERQGFRKTVTFDYHGWPGQVFEQRVGDGRDRAAG
ncbi:GNAT family N-acetyltransferase [Amycolatopsis magusensis]|uniref:GNAT family N-acetyltransferase n=1 Tax=Amycolatopsis magusensis TaxID=882444 RepID=UPI0037965A9D